MDKYAYEKKIQDSTHEILHFHILTRVENSEGSSAGDMKSIILNKMFKI